MTNTEQGKTGMTDITCGENKIKSGVNISVGEWVSVLGKYFQRKGGWPEGIPSGGLPVFLQEEVQKSDAAAECKPSQLFQYGRKRGWLEAQDEIAPKEPINRMTAARILHQFLRLELQEQDEDNWQPAKQLKDLYDCPHCVNHVAQMYVKGIMPPAEPEVFGMNQNISYEEAEDILQKALWTDRKRMEAEGEKTENAAGSPDIAAGSREAGDRKWISPVELQNKSFLLVDVRSKEAYETGHLEGAVNLPMARLLENPKLVHAAPDTLICLYCEKGYLSEVAANCLREAGYTAVYELETRTLF